MERRPSGGGGGPRRQHRAMLAQHRRQPTLARRRRSSPTPPRPAMSARRSGRSREGTDEKGKDTGGLLGKVGQQMRQATCSARLHVADAAGRAGRSGRAGAGRAGSVGAGAAAGREAAFLVETAIRLWRCGPNRSRHHSQLGLSLMAYNDATNYAMLAGSMYGPNPYSAVSPRHSTDLLPRHADRRLGQPNSATAWNDAEFAPVALADPRRQRR